MKNKEQEIKSIKEAQRDLADRLEALEQQPEPRTTEAGDVWENFVLGEQWIIGTEGIDTRLNDGLTTEKKDEEDDTDIFTYLGKFPEVYCKISDVRDALSHEDTCGDSVLSRIDLDVDIFVGRSGRLATREALRKLGITK